MDELIKKAKEHLLSYGYKGLANNTAIPAIMAEFATIQAKESRKLLQEYHNWLLQNTDKKECLHSIDLFLSRENE